MIGLVNGYVISTLGNDSSLACDLQRHKQEMTQVKSRLAKYGE